MGNGLSDYSSMVASVGQNPSLTQLKSQECPIKSSDGSKRQTILSYVLSKLSNMGEGKVVALAIASIPLSPLMVLGVIALLAISLLERVYFSLIKS